MRVDANVSVRRAGDAELGTRCEIKNLNSLRSLGRAIEYEAAPPDRRCSRRASGSRQETRHWDEDDGRTHTLRSKEDADDYRYFPEPDLVPLAPDAEWIDADPRRAAAAAGRAPAPRLADGRRASRRPTDAVAVVVERGLDELRPGRHRGRRRPGAGCSSTSSTTSAGDGRRRCDPTRSPR